MVVSKIDGILQTYREFTENLNKLKEYVEFNTSKESHYRDFQEIIYSSIISRSYTLWETYTKDVFFEYFSLNKETYLAEGSIVEKYRIHELPAYLLDQVKFDRFSESINIKLSKEILVYTSRNIELKELNNMFRRLNISISEEFNKSQELKHFVDDKNLPLSDTHRSEEDKIARALKEIINERNKTSHYAFIDNYYDVKILEDWIEYFKILGLILCKTVIFRYTHNQIALNKSLIGDCVNIFQKTVACIDIKDGVSFDLGTPIYVFKGSEEKEYLTDILISKSFKVDGTDITRVCSGDKVGINMESIIYEDLMLRDSDKFYISNSFSTVT